MKWLHKRHDDDGTLPENQDAILCEHIVLVPRWDRAEDVGREDDVSGYRCEACGTEFTPYEATHLRATEAARLRRRASA